MATMLLSRWSPVDLARTWHRHLRGAAGSLAITLGCAVSSASAFDLTGGTWADGNISMHLQLQLGPPAPTLLDGSADWNAVAESALNDWNVQLTRSRFAAVRDSTVEVRNGNRLNNVVFRPDIFGSAFGDRTLAVTVGFTNRATARFTEQDVVFNSNLSWNSYRGGLRGTTRELRRVALHEFGHVLGLDHPDEASPPQNVIAIMNSTVSGIEALMEDDITGVRTLYDASSSGGTGGNRPVIVAHPQSRTVAVGESYTFAVTATGTGPFTYTWAFQPTGATEPEAFTLASGASYTIGSVQAVDAGTYSCLVRGPGGTVSSNTARLTVTAGPATSAQTTLANLSTRGLVTSGNGVLIAGIVIGGTTPKPILVRAAGPALADFGVGGALLDPSLRIVASATSRTVAENDNWDSDGNAAEIEAAATRLGAFQFRRGARDAAILATLPAGNYTAVVSGVGGLNGVALVEVYDADADAATARTRKLVNIATRGQVISGDSVIIAGLVVAGPGPRTYLIRGIGPTLAKPPFNLSGALLDPFLEIFRGETLLRENDDWDSPSNGMPALRTAATRVGAFALMEERDAATRSGLDAAMLITLPPGNYTAKLSGFEGATGVGLIEVYEVP